MIKIKTQTLSRMALNWAVAKSENIHVELRPLARGRLGFTLFAPAMGCQFNPSGNRDQGGAIAEQERISIGYDEEAREWAAVKNLATRSMEGFSGEFYSTGQSPLVAAMRCLVTSKFGHEIEIPRALAGESEAARDEDPQANLYIMRRDDVLLELTRDVNAYEYNGEYFTLNVSQMEGDECVDHDADHSGLPVTATATEVAIYLSAAMDSAQEQYSARQSVRNSAGSAAEAGQRTEKARVLERAGYSFNLSDFKRPYWEFGDEASCDFEEKAEAIDDAWKNAVECVMGALNYSSEQWDALSFAQQRESIVGTLTDNPMIPLSR